MTEKDNKLINHAIKILEEAGFKVEPLLPKDRINCEHKDKRFKSMFYRFYVLHNEYWCGQCGLVWEEVGEDVAVWRMPHGKFKREMLKDIRRDYLEWYVKNAKDVMIRERIRFYMEIM